MKVRWTSESLRLRITPTELAALVRGAVVETTLALPGGGVWSVCILPGAPIASISIDGGQVALHVVAQDVELLTEGDREGVYFSSLGPPPLRWFIEKDFPCAHPHAKEACEPETERFIPTESYLRRKTRTPVVHT